MASTQARTAESGHEAPRETNPERINRNLSDLLQELRVAALGVQMLFGFLLALPFYAKFSELGASQRDLYRVSVLAAAAATALLIGPVAYHRWVFRRHQKAKLVKLANVEALLGLAMVAVSLCCIIGLVFTVVGAGWFFSLLVAVVMASFLFLWFALPIFDRVTRGENERSEVDAGGQ
jgi:O-antigen/teichoic acid export membrane protein